MGICCELCEAYLDADIDDSAGVAFAAGWRQSWDGWLCPLCAAAWANPASDLVPAPAIELSPTPTRIGPDPTWPEWRRALWWLGGMFQICRWVGCGRDWPELERCHSCNRFLPLGDERWPI